MAGEPGRAPPDFRIRYHWCEGSVPPPHYYETTIHIGPGLTGEIALLPDYPSSDPPEWKRAFAVSAEELGRLYAMIVERDVLRKHWDEVADPPVGGSLEWMEVTAGGQRVQVPSRIREEDKIAAVYREINQFVPQEIWTELMARRDRYAQENAAD